MQGKTRRRRALGALATLLAVFWAGAAPGEDAVVRIGDWTMTAPEITAEFGYSTPALINRVRRDDNAARLLAVDWYSNALIAKAAEDDKLLAKQPGLTAAADALRRKMIATRVLEGYVDDKYAPDERELKQFMDLNEEICRAPGRFRVAQIGVVVARRASEAEKSGAKGRIDEVKKRLAAGEDFGKVADDASDLPAKEPGGELGWLTAQDLARTEGGEKAKDLAKGATSDVIETSQGFLVWKLLDREEPRTLSFEECEPLLKRAMDREYRGTIGREWVEELAKRYQASMNMDAFVAAVRAVELPDNWLEREAAQQSAEFPQP